MIDPVTGTIVLTGMEFLKFLFNKSATNTAADRQYEALDKAQGAITQGKDKALDLFRTTVISNSGMNLVDIRAHLRTADSAIAEDLVISFLGASMANLLCETVAEEAKSR